MDDRATKHMSICARFMAASILYKRGGVSTRARMKCTFNGLEKIAKEQRWGELTPGNITLKQFAKYVSLRLEQGISAHSLQTDISAIRRAMVGAKRSLDVVNLFTAEALAAPSFSRVCTGTAIEATLYAEALSNAPAHIASLMSLQRLLGLRLGEAVASRDSLKSWAKVLALGGTTLRLTHGCIAAKARAIYVHPSARSAVENAIELALRVTEDGTIYAISSADNPKQARQHYSKELAAIGIKGSDSSQSLRRAYAIDQLQRYKDAGYEDQDALFCLSSDLGHGGTHSGCKWVMSNYIEPTLKMQDDDL